MLSLVHCRPPLEVGVGWTGEKSQAGRQEGRATHHSQGTPSQFLLR